MAVNEPRQQYATYGTAVDLAQSFIYWWTHGESFADMEEFARQLRDELNRILSRAVSR